MGAVIVIALGCFFGIGAVSMLRNGHYEGRNHRTPSGKKRYYRAGHPLSFWLLVGMFAFLAVVLISTGLWHLGHPAGRSI